MPDLVELELKVIDSVMLKCSVGDLMLLKQKIMSLSSNWYIRGSSSLDVYHLKYT